MMSATSPLTRRPAARTYVDHPAFHDPILVQQILESLPGANPHPITSASSFCSEEHLGFLRMNCYRFLADQRRQRAVLHGGEADLRAAAQLDDAARAVRDELAARHLDVPHYVARSMTANLDFAEELEGEGALILLRVIDHFDVRFGYKFSTYASAALRRDLRRTLRRLQRHQAVVQCAETLETEDYRQPAREYGEEDVAAARGFLESLPAREREIIEWRFGFHESPRRLSYRLLGLRFGVSGERLRQIVESHMRQARTQLQAG
jgi:RNA polymerase primary sigma factor